MRLGQMPTLKNNMKQSAHKNKFDSTQSQQVDAKQMNCEPAQEMKQTKCL
jgi:hypothetical protein